MKLNISINTKIIVIAVITTIALTFIAFRETIIIEKLKRQNTQIMLSNHVSESFYEIKSLVQSDLVFLYEMINLRKDDNIHIIWDKHTEIIDSIQSTTGLLQKQISSYSNEYENEVRLSVEGGIEATNRLRSNMQHGYSDILKNQLEAIELENSRENRRRPLSNKEYLLKTGELEADIQVKQQKVISEATKLIINIDNTIFRMEAFSESYHNDSLNTTSMAIWWMYFIVIFTIVVSLIAAVYIANSISGPIKKINQVILRLTSGDLSEFQKVESTDESKEIVTSLNKLVSGLQTISDFAQDIEQENFESEFAPLSSKDVIGNALLDMRSNLKNARVEEKKRKDEDRLRSWMNEGIAAFAEILRKNHEDSTKLSREILKKLVLYLNANQGGLFMINEEDKYNIYLELIAVYAFNTEKFLKKRVLVGEGLVGNCALEKKTLYLDNIPDDYIEIESGLGYSTPGYLLIVPMKSEDKVFGVVELASFNPLSEQEITFVEKISENIATTLSNIKINAQTRELLEQSRVQAEEMASQEEEMRQNIEEMQATQEESLRREEELMRALSQMEELKDSANSREQEKNREIQLLQKETYNHNKVLAEYQKATYTVLESSLDPVIIIDSTGIIEFFNSAAEKLWQYKQKSVIGQNIRMLMPNEHAIHHDQHINRYMKTGVKHIIGFPREMPILKKDSTTGFVELFVTETVTDGESKFTAFIKDLTEIKGFEKERTQIKENFVAKEFEYQSLIDELENELITHNLGIPDRETVKDLIIWRPAYETGLHKVDTQHRKLVDIANHMYIAFREGNSSRLLLEYLKDLHDYSFHHFKMEESYFIRFKYEQRESHTKEHNFFLNKVKKLRTEIESGKSEITYQLIQYLKDWLIRHEINADMQYVDLFKQHGVG